MSERSQPIVFDSSAWVELLNRGPLAKECGKFLQSTQVIVPTIVIYEVYKKFTSLKSEDRALSSVSLMSQHQVQDLTREVALTAADLSLQRGLAMADATVLAHAQMNGGLLITLDNDFAGIPGAKVLRP